MGGFLFWDGGGGGGLRVVAEVGVGAVEHLLGGVLAMRVRCGFLC